MSLTVLCYFCYVEQDHNIERRPYHMTATTIALDNMALGENRNRLWNFGPLIFSLFYFFPLIGRWEEIDQISLILHFAIYGSFVILYGMGLYKKGIEVIPIMILMLLIVSLGSMVTSGTSTLFGFIAPLCGFNFRRPYNFITLGILLSVMYLTSQFLISTIPLYFWAPSILISIGLFSFGLLERQDRIHKALHHSSQQKMKQLAAIAERERIARDLHDTLGHSLSSIALKAELASKLHSADLKEKAIDESKQVANLARSLLSEVRGAISGLKQVGLYAQINLLEQRLRDGQFNVQLSVEQVTMNAEQESTLCFIAKEVVTNILRHSDGKNVYLLLTHTPALKLCIQDDGNVSQFKYGNGITGLIERAQDVGAMVDIDTRSGFSVTIEFDKGNE